MEISISESSVPFANSDQSYGTISIEGAYLLQILWHFFPFWRKETRISWRKCIIFLHFSGKAFTIHNSHTNHLTEKCIEISPFCICIFHKSCMKRKHACTQKLLQNATLFCSTPIFMLQFRKVLFFRRKFELFSFFTSQHLWIKLSADGK